MCYDYQINDVTDFKQAIYPTNRKVLVFVFLCVLFLWVTFDPIVGYYENERDQLYFVVWLYVFLSLILVHIYGEKKYFDWLWVDGSIFGLMDKNSWSF